MNRLLSPNCFKNSVTAKKYYVVNTIFFVFYSSRYCKAEELICLFELTDGFSGMWRISGNFVR